jgi:hypothetical protein
MSSLKLRVLFGIVGLVLFVAGEARAASWTANFKIAFMDTDAASGGYIIVPVAGTLANDSTNDPNNCISGTTPISSLHLYAANLNQTQKDLLARTLLSAFLANKSIKLEVSSVTCVNSRPAYGNVAVYQ